ncbi:hypothetical protein [Lyngbya confervoides]|uniref:Uncharacterized protein n=1 Tax=Lyngbya confervoides BDU141951 TaxID=1574623 RepID=A0ABD4T340_9CYAN|nr:hypothetical protein [Lyngbya confervoides]MCM1982939.1 hypothetical protein [Lyngbya confervoides BDU141951]
MICNQCLYQSNCIAFCLARRDPFVRAKLDQIQQCQRRRIRRSFAQKLRGWLQQSLMA